MIDYILLLTVLISLATDIWKRKIYNVVILPAIATGLILNSINADLEGFVFSGSGLLLGLGLLLVPFLLGGIGAGDVKLLTAMVH